jgi:tripartite-type tricarboxylate transporter receptor subunit TctC
MQRRRFLRILAAAVVPACPRIALAQTYPSQPVRLVVGFPAGGPVDIAARIIAPWLAEKLGHPFVVENQPGESGNNATRSVIMAPPDGQTLLVCGPVNVINTTLFDRLDFDFGRDLAPVAGLWRVPLVIEVNPAVPVRALSDLISYAKSNPGKLRVGFAGYGTPQHIGIELFKMMAGIDLTLVPYVGSTPTIADLIAGSIDAMFDPMPSSIAHIRSGKLLPLAVTGPARSGALPDVPIASDFVPGYEAGSWFGICTPKLTPSSVVDKLNMAVGSALEDAGISARLSKIGASAMPGSPVEFGKFIADETERYAGVIRSALIKPR